MAKLVGSLDLRRRPLVRVEVGEDGLLAVIDTGLNGDLMITELSTRSLKFNFGRDSSTVELGDGTVTKVYETVGQLPWLGVNRRIRVLISQNWHTQPDEPSALIGCGLLAPHLLLEDFGQSTVEIQTQ